VSGVVAAVCTAVMQEPLDGPFGPLSKNNTMSPQEFAQMQRADQARAAAGYTVDPSGLASRVGELRAVADAVGSAAATLNVPTGDIGPADLGAAVRDLHAQWLDGLGHMRGKINDMATAINHANANYIQVEDTSQQSFTSQFGVTG
jgi:hypothetical protein